MPFWIIAFLLMVFIVVFAINAAKRGAAHWADNKAIDWLLFLTVFTSFVFSMMISGRLAAFVSDTNIPILEIMGGMLLNLALFFVPILLFIASMLLLIRLIQNLRNPVRASVMTDKENYGKGRSTRR